MWLCLLPPSNHRGNAESSSLTSSERPTNSFEIGQAKSKRYLVDFSQLRPPPLVGGTVTRPDGAFSETEPGVFTLKAFEYGLFAISYLMSVKVAEQGTAASVQYSITIESVDVPEGVSHTWIAPGCSAQIDFDGWLSL